MSVATKRKELAVTEVDGRAEVCRALTNKPGLSEEREGSMGLLFSGCCLQGLNCISVAFAQGEDNEVFCQPGFVSSASEPHLENTCGEAAGLTNHSFILFS